MEARANDRERVVIVGAGFGGLWAARKLAGEEVDVVLIERNNYHTFYPILYQIGAAQVDANDIAYPVRQILRKAANVRFVMGEVEEVDPDARTVRAKDLVLSYDHLILATGSDTSYFGVEGAAEHALPLKEIQEGIALRNHVLSRFERAARISDPGRRRRALTFTIVGGGLTGVELAGALAELIYGPVARDYPFLEREEMSIIVLEMMDRLLLGMSEKLGEYARKRLSDMGVEVRLGATVERVGPASVHLEDGSEIGSETVVWTAGVQGDPDAARWGLPTTKKGTIEVEPTLRVPGRPEIQVAGDLCGFVQDGEPIPMVAPAAIQQGKHAARNVLRQLRGEEPAAFRYDDPGMLATLGRNHGVADVYGRAFTGFLAWLLWVGVHIAKLIGFRNRLAVLMNWGWDYFTYERAVRLILPVSEASELEAARGPGELPSAASAAEALQEGGRGERAPAEREEAEIR